MCCSPLLYTVICQLLSPITVYEYVLLPVIRLLYCPVYCWGVAEELMLWGFVYLYATLPFLVLSTPCPPILLLLPLTSYLLPLTSFLFFSPLCSVSFYPVSIPHLLSCSSTPTSILPYLLSSLCSFSFYPVSIPHLLSSNCPPLLYSAYI